MSYSNAIQSAHAQQGNLIRKKQLLQKVPFSKSTLHAKLKIGSRYYDPSFPRPIYLPLGKTPFWRESEVDAWIYGIHSTIPGQEAANVGVRDHQAAPNSTPGGNR